MTHSDPNSPVQTSDASVSCDPFRSGRQIPIQLGHPTRQALPPGNPPPRTFTSAAYSNGADHAASISSLAIGLGHDIGNIVLPMLCYLDSLDTLKLPREAKSHVKALRESAMQLKRLSNGLNLVAHDSGDWTATASPTHLQAWWSEVQPIVRKSLSRRVLLKADIPDDVPAVNCPAHQLTRAMLNIITNASEAIGKYGTVHVQARRGEAGAVLVSVIDTGRGMSEDIRRRALDPFFTTKKRGLSTGLGLTQVSDIAAAAGGSVSIQSAPGQGTTVTLTLPSVHAEHVVAAKRHRSASIVMNDARIASYARTLLEAAGFNVHQRHMPGEDDSLMIVQGGEDAMRRACDFVRQRANRRAIVLSTNSHQTAPHPGVVVIDQSHRALQKELQHAARDLSYAPQSVPEE